ncbi:unnamed protein product [Microthlaspi erraticum]|uniref:protein-tyrosine-phosphatase n=1 Tax=Microthlaspi erraticum TaxID=1685480 RepID=A0A6D2K065_9BRAS|nr:unnamed protein product [Microthlaspi erraticum]
MIRPPVNDVGRPFKPYVQTLPSKSFTALGYLYSKDKKLDKSKLRGDPEMSKIESSGTTTYQCKKCRRVVLLEEQVMSHTRGEADQEFDVMFPNMIGDVHNKNPGGEETQLEVDVSEGKLMCPECKARIGSFHWSGSYCSCGSKIVPAFQLQMSRVGVITVKNDKNKKKKKHLKKRTQAWIFCCDSEYKLCFFFSFFLHENIEMVKSIESQF